MVFGTSQHLTSPHCTSPHPPAPHHTPCTWASGAPENLAKAMTLMHSGWMEGSPQSGDQLSSSIPPPPHQHFPHLLTPPWWSSLTLPPPSTHFATNSTTSDTSLSLSACASPTSAKIGQHPCPPVLKNSLYSANYIFEACPTTAKVLVLCLHLPASSLHPQHPGAPADRSPPAATAAQASSSLDTPGSGASNSILFSQGASRSATSPLIHFKPLPPGPGVLALCNSGAEEGPDLPDHHLGPVPHDEVAGAAHHGLAHHPGHQ